MENTELQLINTVRCLYQKYGIRSVTMDDVAREMGISKKTLYRLVKDKTELVQKVFRHVMTERAESFLAQTSKAGNAIEELFQVNHCVNEIMRDKHLSMEYDLKKYYPEIHTDLMTFKRQRMYESMKRNLERGKAEGVYRENMDPHILARLYVLRMESIDEEQYLSVDDYTAEDFFNEVFEYHIRGIANEKGIAWYESHRHDFHPKTK